MSYAIRKDGQGWRAVDGKDDCGVDEDFSATQPLPKEPTAQELALKDISKLESSITNRRLREAVLGVDNGWLVSVNARIDALRSANKG